MKEEPERVNENYGLLERLAIQIYNDDIMQIEQLEKEIGPIKTITLLIGIYFYIYFNLNWYAYVFNIDHTENQYPSRISN